jgi:hypothetical protein
MRGRRTAAEGLGRAHAQVSAFGGEGESDHLDVWEVTWDKGGGTQWLRDKKVRGPHGTSDAGWLVPAARRGAGQAAARGAICKAGDCRPPSPRRLMQQRSLLQHVAGYRWCLVASRSGTMPGTCCA